MSTYFTFENLHKAYLDCRRNKSNTANHLLYRQNLEQNLLSLEKSLQNRTYRPGRSIAFVVTHPKNREIFAADFGDRVVHHLLYSYLNPLFEPRFIYDSFACRKNKGTHHAMRRLQKFTIEATKSSSTPYYLQMDIKSFFMSIDKQILYQIIAKHIKNSEILWLTRTVIDFVGYFVRPDYILVRRRVVGQWRRALERTPPDRRPIVIHSYEAHAKHANVVGLTRKMKE